MRFLFVLLLSFSSTLSAKAELVKALNVRADYFPGREYGLGLDLDPNFLISRIYFQDDQGAKSFFTLEDLQSYTPIFKIAGFNVVKLRIAQMQSAQSATVELQILKNSILKTHRSIYFEISFNAVSQKYEIIDTRNSKVIHAAQVVTRYAGPVPVGILDLETE